MIDDKKIEEAAKQHSAGAFISEYWQACYKDAFIDGTKWAINEFLKDLWHPASEKPVPVMGCNNGVLVELNETKKPLHCGKENIYMKISQNMEIDLFHAGYILMIYSKKKEVNND